MTEKFMREAIEISREKMRQNLGGPFGAVIVREGVVVGRGWNQVTLGNDPTAHAEIVAIRDACRQLNQFQLNECDLYTSCEPCPMCLAAAYWARVRRLYFASQKEDAAAAGFDDAMIYQELAVPIPQRKLVMTQLLRSEALPVFDEWKNKSDKVIY